MLYSSVFSLSIRQDVINVVEDLRRSKGGSLAGINFSDLVDRVIGMIENTYISLQVCAYLN